MAVVSSGFGLVISQQQGKCFSDVPLRSQGLSMLGRFKGHNYTGTAFTVRDIVLF